jgi:hypothetical protein
VAIDISISRQRIPMMDPSILEDRTRPLDEAGSAASRLRYLRWFALSGATDRARSEQAKSARTRLGSR